ncbi:MAG: LamG-like jellyroll fold domain-containing protein [Verrucomicrobiota bacterium]
MRLRPCFRIRLRLLLLLWTWFASAASAPAFQFDTYGDGFWTIVNQANGNTLTVNSNGASQAVTGTAAAQQQFELLYNNQNATFRLRNHDSWLCIGARNGATAPGTPVVTVPSYTGAAWQQWNFVDVGGGYFRIVNALSGLALQTDNGTPAHVTLAATNSSPFQYWQFAYQTHYPKKGLAGWDADWAQFGANWLYNWAWGTSVPLPASVVFEPMQWGNWNVDRSPYAAWHSTEKPIYILGFNEPDGSAQANMTTAQAIALWPQLQSMNLPLVSPAPVNPFGGWLGDFYTKIAAHGYRVDFTAVHWYANPSASGLMSELVSVYNTWGRGVWLTEFSTVDWAGTATWTEQDNYRFLAEFLWQAEDRVWFKRYSLFFFSGTPSPNPWDGNGHRGDTFMPDNATLTPYGELYAAWDADRTLQTQTPYFIHNCATCFRLTSARDATGPAASSIRHGDAATQWALVAAPAQSHYYLVSLADGRRLRYSGGLLDLASAGTAGAALEWSFNGPDSNGYYFLDNPNGGVSLSGAGSPPAISFTAVASGSPSDNTRWRLVKPCFPVSVTPPAAPTNLSATPSDRSVTLRWTGSAAHYCVYRSLTSGGPYTRIVSDLSRSLFTDNTVSDGGTCYYVVTAMDGLEDESPYSAEAAAQPLSGLGTGLVAEYKFENTAQDGSGNGFHGTLHGVTGFCAGRVDSTAIAFTGGDDSYVEIPNPLGNDFSIAFWVNTTATGRTGQWWAGAGLVDGKVPGLTNDFGMSLLGTKAAFGIGNPDTTITSTTAINDGHWHHVAATRSGASGAMWLYVDGALQASATASTATRSTPVSLRLGSLQSGVNYFNGSLDEVRLYNCLLSPAQVTQLANVGATLVANYAFEGDALDSSGFANHGSAGHNVTYVPGKVGAQAAQFDGVSGCVQIPASVASDFSLAFWVQTTATGATGQWWAGKGLVDGEVPGAAADFGTSLLGSKAAFGIGNPDTTITSATAINDGQWHHVAATRNNSPGAMKLYVDGVLQASRTGPTGTRSAPPALRIGSIQAGYPGGFFSGALDDVRLYNYELNASQVAALFNPQPLPSPWQEADIGSPGSAGYANYASATQRWTLGGSGSDIGSTADQFHYAYQTFPGPGTIVAQVISAAIDSDGTTNANAKAGIMFRDSASSSAPFVALVHDQTQGLQMLYRDSTGVAAGQQGPVVPLNPPVWLKLVRDNAAFTACYATTAGTPSTANWVALATHNTTMAANALVGLVACAHDNTKLASATSAAVAVTTPADDWRLLWFGATTNAGIAADGADPAGDGIVNVLKRFLNLDPTVPAPRSAWPTGSLAGPNFALTYTRSLAATDLRFQVQWSSDLANWSSNNINDTAVSTNGTTQLRVGSLPARTANPLFLRLLVIAP